MRNKRRENLSSLLLFSCFFIFQRNQKEPWVFPVRTDVHLSFVPFFYRNNWYDQKKAEKASRQNDCQRFQSHHNVQKNFPLESSNTGFGSCSHSQSWPILTFPDYIEYDRYSLSLSFPSSISATTYHFPITLN